MKIHYAQSSFGQTRDEDGITSTVIKRELNIRMHNGWKYITNENLVILEAPNQFGIMQADRSVCIKGGVASEFAAVIFELVYVVDVQNQTHNIIAGQ